MNPSQSKAGILRYVLISCCVALGLPLPAHGQIGSLKKAVEAQQPPKAEAPEQPVEIRARLEKWHQDARDSLAKLDADGASAALPPSITPAELDDRRRDLEQMILTATRSIKNVTALTDARKALTAARAEEAAWNGFEEKPPYPLPMIDELLNERDAIQSKLASSESSLANFENILAVIMADTKAAEGSVSSGIVTVQNEDGEKIEAAKWRLDAARIKSRLLAARAGLLQAGCRVLLDRIAASKAELELTQRKIKTASANSRLNDEDLAKLGRISAERKKSLEKEITAVSKRLKSVMASRSQAQKALDELASTATDSKQPEGLELAKFRMEVAEGRIESTQSVVEGLESLIQLENIASRSYQDRRAIITAPNMEQRAKALSTITSLVERLLGWESMLVNEISTSEADLTKLESRAASIAADDPRFSLVSEQRSATSEKLAAVKRVSQAVGAQRNLVARWVAEYSPEPDEAGFFTRASALATTTWQRVKKIWSFELMSFEDKLEVDGQTITGKIPVTLGMLLRALMFFLIGYWAASHIANRVQRSLVTRGHIAEAQAKTLRNWAMIIVGVFLAISTLSFLKIPLTVFAFFGGALAIGLGFGMQTLIKNFISGIIVLAERKVRVGDILDVEGIIGTVTEVNTRSSVIRSPDDVETMIPNSVFLENRVTNWTLSSSKMRRNLRVGVAYGSQPQKVMEILTESAGRHGLICKNPEPFAVFDDFGDSALIFTLYFWVELGGSTNAMIVASDLRLMIEKRFTEMEIGVPYPQRDMHLTTDKPIEVRLAKE